ncbi:MAG: OmpH family outer membrane protein [Phycisphaerales bacterium]|nr:OmpH family outer membrane protein [Phycisphaerales bacterium]
MNTLCTCTIVSALAMAALRPAAEAEFAGPEPLGPASELVLQGTDGDITVKTVDGRITWGDTPAQRVYSEAFVAVDKLIPVMLQAESFTEEREELSGQMQIDEQRILAALDEVRVRIEDADPDDPDHPAMAEEARNILQQRQAFMQAAQQAMSQLQAAHLERAYREAVEAVKIVAERKGIDIVHRAVPTDDPFVGTMMPEAVNAIQSRSFLVYPESMDITSDVADELGLDLNQG